MPSVELDLLLFLLSFYNYLKVYRYLYKMHINIVFATNTLCMLMKYTMQII